MIVREINRKNGETDVKLVDYKTGETLAHLPHSERFATSPTISQSNGFIGDKSVYRKMQKMDAKLGVGDAVRYVESHASHTAQGKRVAAYKAVFDSRSDKNRWLRAHKRWDADASYGDPCPGDFRNKFPKEFE